MALALYAHPFSSYCHKVLIALWENDTAFEYRHLETQGAGEALSALWPIGKFPLLVDGDRVVAESSIIIEYLGMHYPGAVRLIPEDRDTALEVRFMDRFFDNHVMLAMQKPVAEAMLGADGRVDAAMDGAKTALDKAYAWLDSRLAGRKWAAGADFSMADCAAAPALFYADWVHPIGAHFARVRDYREQLLARPSFARAVEEARPYRGYFPLGAPDRD